MSYIVPRDKPNRCTDCPFIDRITYDCKLMYGDDYSDFESQYEHCPLVELPPHGRLVDLDKMINDFWDCDSMIIGNYELEKIKTVIEAEGETDGR